jgi:hypothetical protein
LIAELSSQTPERQVAASPSRPCEVHSLTRQSKSQASGSSSAGSDEHSQQLSTSWQSASTTHSGSRPPVVPEVPVALSLPLAVVDVVVSVSVPVLEAVELVDSVALAAVEVEVVAVVPLSSPAQAARQSARLRENAG